VRRLPHSRFPPATQAPLLTRRPPHAGPWVNNCVGHANYGHFLRFLIAVDVACAYHLWMVSTCAFHSLALSTTPSTSQVVVLVLNYVACVPVLIAVGVFSLYHLWSVAVNTTTIEGWEKDRAASLMRRGKIREVRHHALPVLALPDFSLVWAHLPGTTSSARARCRSATRTTSATWPTCAPFSDTTRFCGAGLRERSATACRTLSRSGLVSLSRLALSVRRH